MESFGDHIEKEGATSHVVLEAFDAVRGAVTKELTDVDSCKCDGECVCAPGRVVPHDMNMSPMNMQQSNFGYAVDLLESYEGDVSKAVLDPTMKEGMYDDLPGLLKPQTHLGVGYTMSMTILPQEGGKHLVVKLYSFCKRQRPQFTKEKVAQGI